MCRNHLAEVIQMKRPTSGESPEERQARHDALRRLSEEWFSPPDELVETLPKGGAQLKYLSHIWVRKALQDHDPDWWWEPMGYDSHGQPVLERDSQGQPVGLWIWLHVLGTKMPGYGSVDAGKRDAIKELIGDALRNGAMRLIGGSLWAGGTAEKPSKRARGSAKGKTPDPVAKAQEMAVSAPQLDQQAADPGRDAYNAMVEEFGPELVKSTAQTMNIEKYSDITPPRAQTMRAAMLAHKRAEKEAVEREEQLKREKEQA